MTPADAAAYLALRAVEPDVGAAQLAELLRPGPADWPGVSRGGPRGPRRRPAHVRRARRRRSPRTAAFRRLRRITWTLLKALAWQGDLSFGPRATGRRRSSASTPTRAGPAWPTSTRRAGTPSSPTSGRTARRLRTTSSTGSAGGSAPAASHPGVAHRPSATASRRSTSTGSRRSSWATTSTARRDAAEHAVRLLPGYDQWVLGPGTADATSCRRRTATRSVAARTSSSSAAW